MLPSLTLDFHPEVLDALQTKRPVVALASSPLTHTIPWPTNLETVRRCSEAARQEGATLAVMAIWQGRLKVGLSYKDLETLTAGGNFVRAGRRDLASALVGGKTAGMTVSASMYIASRAGIRVLATGATGGAAHTGHDQERHAWDISADLIELFQTPVAVVSAGTRSVYNKAYTAEVLETFRVPVIGYQTDAFPTFYLAGGTYPASSRAENPGEVAAILATHWGLDGKGALVALPTPAAVAISPDELIPALHAVEELAAQDKVPRRDLSPFLMEKLNRLTRGKTLRAYQEIMVENIHLAAKIDRELIALGSRDGKGQ